VGTVPQVEPTVRVYAAPSVAHLPAGDPALGCSLLLNDKIVSTPATMPDSGANVNLITERAAKAANLDIIADDRNIAVHGTGTSPTYTIGRVAGPVSVGLCMGTPGEVAVRVPLYVIPTPLKQCWDLLLGTGFLNVVGARLLFDTAEFQYTPELHFTTDDPPPDLPTYTIPLTTTSANPSPEFMAQLQP